MNSRRQFFGKIATMFAATAASSILLPKFSDRFIWKSNSGIPEVYLQLESKPIVAKCRKLKAVWTVEFEQDLQAYHSISAENRIEELIRSQSSPITYSRRQLTDYVM